jgi:1-acyl-sn-glycerol-3-phosphate acyltransferase
MIPDAPRPRERQRLWPGRPWDWYRVTVAAGRLAMTALDVKLRIRGEQHIPIGGPAILAANHVSYVDFVPIAAAANQRQRKVRFFVRHDAWEPPGMQVPMTSMRHIPVDRQAPAAAYLQARRLLRQGELLGNFPEAGISYSFTVRSLMKGTAALGRETGVPVVPVAIWGSQRIYSVGRPRNGKPNRYDLTRGRVVDVLIGSPLQVPPDADLVAWTCHFGKVLTGLVQSLQTAPEHRPAAGEFAPWYPAHLGGHAPDRRAAGAWDVVPKAAVSPSWEPIEDPLP